MGSFFDNWAWAHRNAKAWGAAIFLAAVLVWAVLETGAERIDYQELNGHIIELSESGNTDNAGMILAKIRVKEGPEVKLILPPQYQHPKVGDTVPLIYERYDDGKAYYFFDTNRWVSSGGVL